MPRPLKGYTRRTRSPYDKAALGVYKGPARLAPAPKLTPYRRRVLQAIRDKQVHLGKGQHRHGFRWNDSGAMTTVSATVNLFIACGWARVVGARPELTGTGEHVLAEAGGAT